MKRATVAAMDHGWEYSVDDYVRIDDENPLHKYEFDDGEIRMMGGGTPEHARLALVLHGVLLPQLQGKPCVMYSADARIRVLETGLITYPDMSIICGPPVTDIEDRFALTNPTVVVEVTSKASERYDRGKKRFQYQLIESLREYVIISHRERAIDVYTRADDGSWPEAVRSGSGQRARLRSLDCDIDVDEFYSQPITS